MEFLNTLYESEYFVYIVGGAILVLLILFLVILLSGKKKKEPNNPKEKVMQEATEKSVITDTNPSPVKEESLDATKEFKPEDLATLKDKLNEEVKPKPEVTPVVEPMMDKPVEEPKPEFNMEMGKTTVIPVTPTMPPRDPLIAPEPKVEEPTVVIPTAPETPTPEVTKDIEPTLNTPEPKPRETEEKISFKVNDENELPKLNADEKEL
ncbi:MAG TPA: hypothetical protein PLX66_01450 [Bacilli bacterium]|nr:hypothetical protein [Bacilli bacterium]